MKLIISILLFLCSFSALAQTPTPTPQTPKAEAKQEAKELQPIVIPPADAQKIIDADKDAALHAARLDEARQRWRAQVLLVFVTLGLKLEDYEFVPGEKDGQLILVPKAKPKLEAREPTKP